MHYMNSLSSSLLFIRFHPLNPNCSALLLYNSYKYKQHKNLYECKKSVKRFENNNRFTYFYGLVVIVTRYIVIKLLLPFKCDFFIVKILHWMNAFIIISEEISKTSTEFIWYWMQVFDSSFKRNVYVHFTTNIICLHLILKSVISTKNIFIYFQN